MVGAPLSVQFQVSTLLFALFYFYFNCFSNYTHYFKTRKLDSLQKRAPLAGAEAAYRHSLSGTINVPCPMEEVAVDACPAA
jgi:hypothetical protein